MPTLLQIDTCLNNGSTGRITESIAKLVIADGWDCYIMHSARYATLPSVMNAYQIGTKAHEYIHYIEGLLLDNHGLCSTTDTKRAIKEIERIKPDVIQLHCIHGYFLNYKVLFNYLNSTNIPLVWTFHDCWAFTGHCAHFVTARCEKWKNEGCHNCPLHTDYPKSYVDKSERNFKLKKSLFTINKHLHIVPVSQWLASYTKESFFKGKDIRVINNGIDTSKFHPCAPKSTDVFKIVGVATAWNQSKGLYDFYKIRKILSSEKFEIVLVGLKQNQVDALPKDIRGITRTESIEELAHLYSEANVLLNPTYADSFPTVNMEALACGTPVITYRTGGSPEIIDEKTGIVVEQGDVQGLIDAIHNMATHPLSLDDCRNRAVQMYDKNDRFMDYINLYNELISK